MQKQKTLCESGVTRLLAGALADCRSQRERRSELIFNATACLIFFGAVGCFLYYRYKGRLSPEQVEVKRREDYAHIVDRLQSIEAEREKGKGLITKLPMWDMRAAAPHLR